MSTIRKLRGRLKRCLLCLIMTIPTAANVVLPHDTVISAKKAVHKKNKSYCNYVYMVLPFVLGACIGGFLAFLCFYEVKWAPRNAVKSAANQKAQSAQHLVQDKKKNVDNSTVVNKENTGSNLTVLCIILMKDLDLRYTDAISDTYGQRCNTTAYYTADKPHRRDSHKHPIPNNDYTVHLLKNAGKTDSWSFQQAMFGHMQQHYTNQPFDWIFVCDSACYAVLENLRLFASTYPLHEPMAAGKLQAASSPIGYLFPSLVHNYLDAQAGYMLNNRAFSTLMPNINDCAGWWYFDYSDRLLSKCLDVSQVSIVDGQDWQRGGHRFIPASPKEAIARSGLGADDGSRWYWPFSTNNNAEPCCSDRAISFGNLKPAQIHSLEYSLYNLRPFGVNQYYDSLYNEYDG